MPLELAPQMEEGTEEDFSISWIFPGYLDMVAVSEEGGEADLGPQSQAEVGN